MALPFSLVLDTALPHCKNILSASCCLPNFTCIKHCACNLSLKLIYSHYMRVYIYNHVSLKLWKFSLAMAKKPKKHFYPGRPGWCRVYLAQHRVSVLLGSACGALPRVSVSRARAAVGPFHLCGMPLVRLFSLQKMQRDIRKLRKAADRDWGAAAPIPSARKAPFREKAAENGSYICNWYKHSFYPFLPLTMKSGRRCSPVRQKGDQDHLEAVPALWEWSQDMHQV